MRLAPFSAAILAASAQAAAQVQVPGNPPAQTSLSPQESTAINAAFLSQLINIETAQPSIVSIIRALPHEIPASDQAAYNSYEHSLINLVSTGGSLAGYTGDILSFLSATVVPTITDQPWVFDVPPSLRSEYDAFETSLYLAEVSLGREILATAPGATPTSPVTTPTAGTSVSAAGSTSTSTAAAAPAHVAVAGGVLAGAVAVAAFAL